MDVNLPRPSLKDVSRITRFINPVGLALGAIGTFMGFFNRRQISTLKEEASRKQNRIIEVQQTQQQQIYYMNESLQFLLEFMSHPQTYDVTLLAVELDSIEREIIQRLHWATHAIQQAQNHRLAVDFLTPQQQSSLYIKLRRHAREIGHNLLTTQASDLYQLELTYFYDGANVNLMLHVPCIPADAKLRLLKLHPFPLPLNENYTITPDVDDEILAISPGFTRYSVRINAADLIGCHSINKVYLCDRYGVLSKELNNSCLGALYLQDYTIAKELCDFKIRPSQEVVRQLLDNWFLVYTPVVQTGFVQCLNGTQREAYMKIGINKIHLSPGCQADLIEHRLHADGSITLPTDLTHFEWAWDAAGELNMDPKIISMYIDELIQAGISNPSLEDLSHLKLNSTSKFKYVFYILGFIFSCVALGLVIIIILAFTSDKFGLDYRKILAYLRPAPPLVEPIENPGPISYPLLNPPANAPLYNLN
jgi:hypothetical protein